MKKQILIFLPLMLAAQISFAGSFTDTATVISVDKVYKTHTIREPYQDCYIQEFYQNEGDGSATNEIVGGLFGGLIGNQFGKGDGKKAMTAAGALLGASLAHDDELEKSKNARVVSKEVCETKYRTESQQQLNHYRVEYEYDGRTFTYTTRSKPYGDTIKVRIEVSPRQLVEKGKTFEQVLQLAEQGDAESQYEIALAYDLGVGVQKDLSKAFEWYSQSAEQDYAKSQYNLGIFYALAKSVDKDIEQSKHWIRKANENGYSGGSVF